MNRQRLCSLVLVRLILLNR